MAHKDAHELAGQTVTVTTQLPLFGESDTTVKFVVEDWWDRVSGGSWMDATGNLAAMNYGVRSGLSGLPLDDEVLYGHVGAFGHLVHATEITAPERAA
ncbi:hypothetical protein ORV05_04695 [Amycolatopsis cynarae]|uniref:Uncharacterized protein n=1 Tax=Amycolatopsis cynarae TaxID=2995223 RepID=A0ABY7B6N6_9PSEU|nr:hypothetical protein [Amycolatopsis sp. HUAS 11-8]WAL67089.1 hypothetical protein ORV05_04695 [Amycolatopsis sp. HUAS 11-8]